MSTRGRLDIAPKRDPHVSGRSKLQWIAVWLVTIALGTGGIQTTYAQETAEGRLSVPPEVMLSLGHFPDWSYEDAHRPNKYITFQVEEVEHDRSALVVFAGYFKGGSIKYFVENQDKTGKYAPSDEKNKRLRFRIYIAFNGDAKEVFPTLKEIKEKANRPKVFPTKKDPSGDFDKLTVKLPNIGTRLPF